jgi:quercetin dioxygenase-like cupin family protein
MNNTKWKVFLRTSHLRSKMALVAGLFIVALFAVVAYAATTLILAVGTIPESEFFGGPATVTVRTLTIQPGEVLPWHYHPGYAFNVVRSGVLTVEDGCSQQDETLTAGQAFEEVEGHVHRAKNLGTEPVVVYNTFVMPQGNPTTVNIPNNERKCGPPSNADECKFNGWINFTHPTTFNDQGECIQFVNHRPRAVVPIP